MRQDVNRRSWHWASRAVVVSGMGLAGAGVVGMGGCKENVLTVQHGRGEGDLSMAAAAPAMKPARDSTFFVAVSRDGSYEGRSAYAGSGQMTTNLIVSALRSKSMRVEQALGPVEYEYLLSRARELKADYLVNPQIFNWENRANTWTGKDDKVTLRIDIVDVATGARVDTATLEGSGKKDVRVPGDLVKPLLKKWAEEIR